MDIVLIIISFLLLIVGMIGSFLPVIPGPPLGWIGLLLLHLTDAISMNWIFLGTTLAVAIVITILDYVIPAIGTRRFGGSNAGAVGATIGLFLGMLTPIPLGILIGPFVGAFLGEVIVNKTGKGKALRAAFGSFLGFLASSFSKFFVSLAFVVLFFVKVYEYADKLFVWQW